MRKDVEVNERKWEKIWQGNRVMLPMHFSHLPFEHKSWLVIYCKLLLLHLSAYKKRGNHHFCKGKRIRKTTWKHLRAFYSLFSTLFLLAYCCLLSIFRIFELVPESKGKKCERKNFSRESFTFSSSLN